MADERVQRRLAAILAADVVGYSRLVRADEEGTLARLKDLRDKFIDPALAAHDGRIVKTMGDGLLVEFGSVVDAVRAAAVIQQRLAEKNDSEAEAEKIVFRVGINLGDVIIEGDDIHGDGVNVAARLETLSEPGGICVSDGVYDQVRDRLDLAFTDMGEQTVKNIDRPIRAWLWTRNGVLADTGLGLPPATGPLTDKPSIAILPFANMSGDPEQEYFADGITEDIITGLSRFSELFVIARNSSFTYKGRVVRAQDIRRELGARYIAEGSVRKSGDRVRVTIQLADSETGNQVWAERYDRQLVDIFDVQDELTQAIVAILPGRISAAEQERIIRKPPRNMEAYDCVLAGKIHHHRVTKEDNAEALRLLEHAIELDPDFAEAYAWKACTAGQALQFGFCGNPQEMESEAIAAVTRALSLDENNVECHRLLCEVHIERCELDQASGHGGRAIALNPNDPRLVAQQGELLTWMGRPEEGVEWIEKAMRLDPYGMVGRAHLLGRALYGARRYADALAAYRQIISPNYAHHADMAACLGQMDMGVDAEKQAALVLKQKPEFSIRTYVSTLVYAEQADRDHMLEGLTKAGLPN